MTDHRAKLECRYLGEDGCTTIERHRERHLNLDGDYGSTNAAPMGHAVHTPTSLGFGGGCMVFAPHLRMVVWPRKFWSHLLKRYDRIVNPAEFLQIYTTSILAPWGNEAIMANYFPMALTDMAQSWLMNLPPGSLYS
jgi:hypothetical protein